MLIDSASAWHLVPVRAAGALLALLAVTSLFAACSSTELGGGDGDDPLPLPQADCDAIAPELAPFGPALVSETPLGSYLMGRCGHVVHGTTLLFPDHSLLELGPHEGIEFSPTGELLLAESPNRLVDLATKSITELPFGELPPYFRGWVPTFDRRLGSRLWSCADGRLEVHEPGTTTLIDEVTCDWVVAGVGAPILLYPDGEQKRIANTDTGTFVTNADIRPEFDHGDNTVCSFVDEIGFDGDFIYSGRRCYGILEGPDGPEELPPEILEYVLVDARTGTTVRRSSANERGYSVPQRGGAWWFHEYSNDGVRGRVRILDGDELVLLFEDVLSVSMSDAGPLYVANRNASNEDQLLRSVDGGHTFDLLGVRDGLSTIVSNREGTALAVLYGHNGVDGLELWTEETGWAYPVPLIPTYSWLEVALLGDATMLASDGGQLKLLGLDGGPIVVFPQGSGRRSSDHFLVASSSDEGGDAYERLDADGTRTTLIDAALQLKITAIEVSSAVPIAAIRTRNATQTEFSLYYGRP